MVPEAPSFPRPRSLTIGPGKRFQTFIGFILASVNLYMEPEPQSPGPMFLGVKETVVEWESRLSETQGRYPMGYPLPIIKDTSRTSQSLHGPPDFLLYTLAML